jgi:sensor domain CHASE-containing protein
MRKAINMDINTLLQKHPPTKRTWIVVALIVAAVMIADYFLTKEEEKDEEDESEEELKEVENKISRSNIDDLLEDIQSDWN